MTDTGDAYKLEAELPGFKKDDIKIDIENDCLTISVELKSVNNRYLDTSVRMPRSFLFAEDAVKAAQDAEGLQTMRILGRNIAFLVKAIALAKEEYGLPEKEAVREFTSFPDGK